MAVLLAAEDGEITRLGLKYKPGKVRRLYKHTSTKPGQAQRGESYELTYDTTTAVRSSTGDVFEKADLQTIYILKRYFGMC